MNEKEIFEILICLYPEYNEAYGQTATQFKRIQWLQTVNRFASALYGDREALRSAWIQSLYKIVGESA